MSARPIKRGTVVQVYDDPLAETRPAYKATVLRCIERNVATWEGRTLRRYEVNVHYEGQLSDEHAEPTILDPVPA